MGNPAAFTIVLSPPYYGLPNILQGGDSSSAKQAGLPNITGRFVVPPASSFSGDYPDGAFYSSKTANGVAGSAEQNKKWLGGFDASLSNPIYGSSSTVQPPSIVLIPQLRY